MTTVIATIFVFGLLVLVHELGHFITAKLTGMRVSEFAIGFGPKLLWKKSGETEYSVRAIPLGALIRLTGWTRKKSRMNAVFPASRSGPERL